jgi:hypothetical protein
MGGRGGAVGMVEGEKIKLWDEEADSAGFEISCSFNREHPVCERNESKMSLLQGDLKICAP